MNGWIMLHRKILDNPVVCKDSDHFAIWGYLLLSATHDDYPALFNGTKIILKAGQLITGRKSISTKFNISESKTDRVLKRLEIEQQIEQQTCSRNRLITILNWQNYQCSEQQSEHRLNNNWTTSEQPVNTNNNIITKERKKKEKKEVPKRKYGEYENVMLTDIDLEKLKSEFPDYEERIERLSGYIASKGASYKDHLATIRNWAKRDIAKAPVQPERRSKEI